MKAIAFGEYPRVRVEKKMAVEDRLQKTPKITTCSDQTRFSRIVQELDNEQKDIVWQEGHFGRLLTV